MEFLSLEKIKYYINNIKNKNINKEIKKNLMILLEKINNIEDFVNEVEFQEDMEKEKKQIKKEFDCALEECVFPLTPQGFFLEIKTGVGGLDAQDWSSMLLKMYIKYFDSQGIKYKIISKNSDVGIKNITILVKDSLYKYLGESGVHRLVRISPFNAQKKRQTSFSSLYVFGNEEVDAIAIQPKDLEISTYRASGAGGQHVNKTDSAIRIKHLPSNIVVESQSERSQQQNRNIALKMLQNKLFQHEKIKNQEKNTIINKEKVEWGNQFRSYVLDPYKIIKDKRLNIEIKSNVQINKILQGDMDVFISSYKKLQISKFLQP